MASSRSSLLSVLILAAVASVAFMVASPSFVSAPAGALRGASVVPAGALLAAAPMAANAEVLIEGAVPDVDSSVSVAAMIEPIMWGMVLGVFPITTLGLYVAAWLQFKKGPTLGL
eukprot:CAMPEP_0178450734 /NCGR_PEP_ID=MMETSP0689_2-20121128/43288_1 /TAXON_ID=160604 /ORGANISM="Amphidinium massartii, Strain CS-259" /LENGTH=114 /DNA_ID=CAMNT_0020076231 /DNA_START=65 /DNA_END=409 /DNA_ORIENTATION=-